LENANIRPDTDTNILYEDNLVSISSGGILFRKYYVPFGTPKLVRFNEIERIETYPPTIANGQWRIWGTGNFVTWFPCDTKRPTRDRIFLLRQRNAKISIGFTVENSALAQLILEGQGVTFQSKE